MSTTSSFDTVVAGRQDGRQTGVKGPRAAALLPIELWGPGAGYAGFEPHRGRSIAAPSASREKWGERPLAVIVPCPNSAATADHIRADVGEAVDRGTISKVAIPERVLFVGALERTSVGKLDKKALRTRYRAAEAASAVTKYG